LPALGQDWYRLPALTLPAPLRGQNRKTVGMLYLWFEVENGFELEFCGMDDGGRVVYGM
jgi:hypothetical protein